MRRPAETTGMRPEPLVGGTANRGRVTRVGGMVRRPVPPCRESTHAVLRHLTEAGFTGSPRMVGHTEQFEYLEYIDGTAPLLPLPDWAVSDRALISIARLLREFHAVVASFGTGRDLRTMPWAVPVPEKFRGPTISHNDIHPANVVFRDGLAVALIDFDLAAPGCPEWDICSALRSFAPLTEMTQRTDAQRRGTDALQRVRLFLDAYGASPDSRRRVVDALLPNHDWTYQIVRAQAAAGHPGFVDYWARWGPASRISRRWCVENLDALRQAAG